MNNRARTAIEKQGELIYFNTKDTFFKYLFEEMKWSWYICHRLIRQNATISLRPAVAGIAKAVRTLVW